MIETHAQNEQGIEAQKPGSHTDHTTPIAENLSYNHTNMPNTPAITPLGPEDITHYIGESTGTMDIEKIRNLNYIRPYVVCGDGRTRGKEVDRDEKEKGFIQIFGGASGYNLGCLGALKQGLGSYLSNEQMIAFNNQFLSGAHNMYEHTACELHGEADCGCGHLNNLRKKATIFGLDDELIAYHQVLMKTKAITPHALADKHREKGVLIIMGSQAQDEEGKKYIHTILSNTLGESDQFFVVNMDALNIITDETAKRYSEIITNLYPSIAQKIETDHKGKGESLHNIVRTYLTRGLYTQTIDTAKALASQLEDNTFIINGKDITPMKLSNVFSLMETTT